MRAFVSAHAVAAILAIAVLPCALDCASQTAPPETQAKDAKAKTPTGIVTGTIYCADTNLPARLAQVFLIPTSDGNPVINGMTATDLNGRFALRKLPDGRFYVAAKLPGYVDLLTQISASRLAAMSDEERKEFDAHVTTVVVSAAQPADLSIRINRGTEIDGTVTYDDGSPAISLQIGLKPKTESANGTGFPEIDLFTLGNLIDQSMRTTDDHGRFRILGVPPGEYLVSVTVPTGSADPSRPSSPAQMVESGFIGGLVVYTGGSLRASTARSIKVTAGGASADADIIIPLSKLHSVHGEVILKRTGQPPPSATLQLVYADTQESARIAVASNGHFDLYFVPEESYFLRAIASAAALPNVDIDDDDGGGGGFFISQNPSGTSDPWKQAGAAQVPLVVKGDVEDITIAVPDPPPSKHAAPAEGVVQEDVPAAPPQ
jgi:hypothetical protein